MSTLPSFIHSLLPAIRYNHRNWQDKEEGMNSLYDELAKKVNKDKRVTKRGVSTFDLTLLLFNARDSLNELWQTADHYLQSPHDEALANLQDAVEKLRPIFGERSNDR
jgi:hypothetical protein